jgi:hypothetical protein
VAEPESVGAVAEGINALFADRALRCRLAAGGRTTALSRDWNEIFDRLVEEEYQPLVGRRAAVRAA